MDIISLQLGSLAANCYLISSSSGGCAIIDPGAEAERTGDYTVYPGHGRTTTLQFERQHNPYFPKYERR